jgi:alkanesulfonate monooxygenase SsuD/methylene tetrahydromethanopterin reductase-like flavin-dependent oxidoreductase (luciferase family)
LSDGRFRLGIGTGHKKAVEDTAGKTFEKPISRLSEYVQILRHLLKDGEVDWDGIHFQVDVKLRGTTPIDTPIMTSALGPKAFELGGALSDGVIGWYCPKSYLKEVAIPAMQKGAQKRQRSVPRLICGVPVVLNENYREVKNTLQERRSGFPTSEEFGRLYDMSGVSEDHTDTWTDTMMDEICVWGDESQVQESLQGFLDAGVTELIAVVLPTTDERNGSVERSFGLVSDISRRLV